MNERIVHDHIQAGSLDSWEYKLAVLEVKCQGQEERIKELQEALSYCIVELEGWLKDQGGYGTTGYDEMIPQLKALLR